MASGIYEFQVDGRFPVEAREAFCDMVIDDVGPGTTLRGCVIDDSHLHGIVEQLRALGLTVVSARPVAPRRVP